MGTRGKSNEQPDSDGLQEEPWYGKCSLSSMRSVFALFLDIFCLKVVFHLLHGHMKLVTWT